MNDEHCENKPIDLEPEKSGFWNRALLFIKGNGNPWKRGNRHHVNQSKAAWKIRAHKRARWEMAKLSRRANRR